MKYIYVLYQIRLKLSWIYDQLFIQHYNQYIHNQHTNKESNIRLVELLKSKSIETSAKKEEGAVKKKEDLKECTEDKTEQNDIEDKTERNDTAETRRKKVKLKAKRCRCT